MRASSSQRSDLVRGAARFEVGDRSGQQIATLSYGVHGPEVPVIKFDGQIQFGISGGYALQQLGEGFVMYSSQLPLSNEDQQGLSQGV